MNLLSKRGLFGLSLITYCSRRSFDMLTPYVQLRKLNISTLGYLAQKRLARGVRLNHVEAVVYGTKAVLDDALRSMTKFMRGPYRN